MVDAVYDISKGGATPITEKDSYLFGALKEGSANPYTTKAFMFDRDGDTFTLQNAGGTGGASSASSIEYQFISASPNKRWVAASHSSGDTPQISLFENNFDGTLDYVAAFDQLAGSVQAICFSPDSTKLFAVGLGSSSQSVLQYIKLSGSPETWSNQATMSATTLGIVSPDAGLSHHPTDDKLLISNGSDDAAIKEVTYTSTAFNTPTDFLTGATSTNYQYPTYSPDGNYVIYGETNSVSSQRHIRLHKIGVGVVDSITNPVAYSGTPLFEGGLQWFADSSHFVAGYQRTVIANDPHSLVVIKRTGDSIAIQQVIDYDTEQPSLNTISLSRDTYPLLAIGAGDNLGTPSGGWDTGSPAVKKHGRILKFNSATGLFDTTPIQEFATNGTAFCFAPDAAFGLPG